MRAVLAHRQARAYLLAQILSLFGDTSLWFAAGIWVKEITGSASRAGLVFFFYGIPYVFGPFAGVLVDRVRRAPLMVAVNSASALVVLLLLFVHDKHQVWLVYVVIFVYGVSGTLINSAQSALLTTMLPSELLAEANGVLATGREALRLVSPLLGAGVVAATGTAAPVAIFDAATFGIAAVVLVLLRVAEPRPHREPMTWWAEFSAGGRHILRTPTLRHIVGATAVALLVVGFGETVIFPIAQLGLHRSPSFVGVLISVMSVGSIAGGLTGAWAVRRFGDGRALALGLVAFAVGNAFLAASSLPVVLAGVIVEGAGVPWLIVAFTTSIQVRTPSHLQGRAYAAADMAASLPQTLSIALGAVLVAVVDYRLLLAAMSVVIGLAALYLLTRRIDWSVPSLDVDTPVSALPFDPAGITNPDVRLDR
jgi:MFS family permease